MTGNITRRGSHSWRIKYEAGERDPKTGKRQTKFATVRGTKKAAQMELTRLLAAINSGTAVNPTDLTVAEYMQEFLRNSRDLTPKTAERYAQSVTFQIVPHLGSIPLQRLRPAHIEEWHATLMRSRGQRGRPLSTHTIAHAHRVLHRALQRAVKLEFVGRNVASAVSPPKIVAPEIEILSADQMAEFLNRTAGHALHPFIAMALGTGMRRGECCALPWGALDLDAGVVRVESSLEQTKAGLRLKPPKSRHGRRTISLPANVVEIMREYRRKQLELRLALGLGRLSADDYVFPHPEGGPWRPDALSSAFSRLVHALKLPRVRLHALRHSHASALISAGLDVVSVSRRLGHGSANITLGVYGHLFASKDAAAADAIDAAMRGTGPKP